MDLLEKLVKFGDRTAIVSEEGKLTYAELYEEALAVSEALKKQGKGAVLVYGRKRIDAIVAIMACLIAHRPYIPVDASCPGNRIKAIIKQAKPTLCICEDSFPYDLSHAGLDDISLVAPDDACESDVAYMIFTSGSTGVPKGVMVTRDNLANFISWISSLPALGYEYVHVLNQASFAFDLSVADIYYSITNGHTLHLLTKEYPALYEELKEIEVMFITPSFAKLLLTDSAFCGKNYPCLKTIVFCGESLSPGMVRKLLSRFDIQVVNAYGPTEACCMVSASSISCDMTEADILPCGDLSTAAVDIRIEDGEIVLAGKSVAKGYIHGERFNGVYRTGDLGRIENGKLYCLGRKDRQIKYKGYRIELDEIEAVMSRIEEISDCCVMASKDNHGVVKRIHAYVVTSLSSEELIQLLEQILPAYMVPIIHICDCLPRNENDKVDRKALENK